MRRSSLILLGLLLAAIVTACGARGNAPQAPDPGPGTIEIYVTPTPLPTLVPTPIPTTVVERYTVRSGDTLGAVAARYDLSIEELMRLNGITNPNALQIGQVLKVTVLVPRMGPSDYLLPDSEVVYSPAYASFDIAAFATQANGYLATYREKVEGETMTGAQIIQLVADRFSVGPRVLLALLEFEGGWVTGTSPTQTQLAYPMGQTDTGRASLFYQASWAANHLNEGYYGRLTGQLYAYRFKDRSRARIAGEINPGTAAVQNVLALTANWDTWQSQVSPTGFIETYRRLFGDPAAVAINPLIPPDVKQPALRLPWNDGSTWYFTGGPHSAWGDLAAWSAIDLTPSDTAGSGSCNASRDWALAAAPGRVIRSEHGRVLVSLTNNNFPGAGWVLLYMHMATTGRAQAGTQVNTGDRIGHPSCEGGDANASHLHLARLYNGQWIDPVTIPYVLSDWQITELDQAYDGQMTRGAEVHNAVNGRDATKNAITTGGGK